MVLRWSDFGGFSGPQALRADVRGAIEEASHRAIRVDDWTADELITVAQAFDLPLALLHTWIYDPHHPQGFTRRDLVAWALEHRFIRAQDRV